MAKTSAGILLYRINKSVTEVFLVHPGGPFFKKKDLGVWSIPKGEFTDGEDGLAAAKREFLEETGIEIAGVFTALAPVRQNAAKYVYAWAVQGDLDETQVRSNFFEMEWPPKSGSVGRFPEIDQGRWFTVETAKQKIIPGQVALLAELEAMLQTQEP